MAWIVTEAVSPAPLWAEQMYGVSISGAYFYSPLIWYDGVDYTWAVEKRRVVDGGLEWFVTDSPGTGSYPNAVTTDATYVYTGGFAPALPGSGARVEKRRQSDGGVEWNQNEVWPGNHEVNGIAVDASGVYIAGRQQSTWNYLVQRRSLITGAPVWTKLLGGVPFASSFALDICTYGTDVYACGILKVGALFSDQQPYVEKRDIATGGLTWGIGVTPYPGYSGYAKMAVDANGVYSIGNFEVGGGIRKIDLVSRALSDGHVQWINQVDTDVLGGSLQSVNDLLLLGDKLYVVTIQSGAGIVCVIESRSRIDGSFIARDILIPYDNPAFFGIDGISNAPADEIIGSGWSDFVAPPDQQCYMQDFLASLPVPSGPTMDQIMRGCKWFNGGSFQGMYLGWR